MGQLIATSKGGRKIVGEIVHRTHTDISVNILEPYQNLGTCSHIPFFMAARFNFLAEYGDTEAQTLLVELYDVGAFIEANEIVLKEKAASLRESIRQLESGEQSEKDDLASRKQRLWERASSKRISIETYKQQLASIRQQALENSFRKDRLVRRFIDENFPRTLHIGVGLDADVIDVLEARKALRAGDAQGAAS